MFPQRPRSCLLGGLFSGLLVAGCTVGPDYQPPSPDVGPVFPSAVQPAVSPIDRITWWRRLGDARLAEAVDRAIRANADVEMAQARVAQSRAALAEVKALQEPIGSAGAVAGRGSVSGQGPAGQLLTALHAPREDDLYAGVLDLSWEVDLFGGVRRAREARSALLESEIDRLDAVKVVVAAETARAYVTLRGLQLRQSVLAARVTLAARALDLARRRMAVGEGAGLAVHDAAARLAALQGAQPTLDAAIVKTLNALDVLEGGHLGDSRSLLHDPAVLPVQMAGAVLETPAVAVARRPDVAAAERVVAAANADIGVAIAEYYPSVQLGALAGLSSTQIGHLLDSNAGLWAGGAAIEWRLLDWNRIGADVAAAKGRKAEALAAYRGTALAAAAEIDTALAALAKAADVTRRSDDALRELTRTAAIAARTHAVGEVALSPVLVADDGRLAAEDALVQARVAALEDAIDLYRALGGGDGRT